MSNPGPGRSPPSIKSITPPVRAGVAVGHMRGFMHGAPQRIVETPEPGPAPRLPSWKRLALRLFRPLKAAINPALFRMQTRMASAVDGSFTASVVLNLDKDLRAQLKKMESDASDQLSMLRDDVYDARKESEQLRLKLEDNLAITMLQVGESRSLSERLDTLLHSNLIPLKDAMALHTAAGYVLAPADDDRAIVDLVACCGLPPAALQAVIGFRLTEGGGLIDIGAADGRLAVAGARRVGPEGQVLSFGRNEAAAALIARAAQLNRTPWLQARTAASAAEALDAAPSGAGIDLVRIADEADPAALLPGLRRLLAGNPRLVIVVQLRSPASQAAWRSALEAEGFETGIVAKDDIESLPPGAPGGLGEVELVFTRPDSSPGSRLVRS